VESVNGVLSYVSKYITKDGQDHWEDFGRAWGTRRKQNLPIKETEKKVMEDCELEAYIKFTRNTHANRVANIRAWQDFPQPFSKKEIEGMDHPSDIGWAEHQNWEAEQWREGVKYMYYKEELKNCEKEPWRVPGWLIMDNFDEFCEEARTRRQSEIDLCEAYINGNLPDVWYNKFNVSRDPLANGDISLNELDAFKAWAYPQKPEPEPEADLIEITMDLFDAKTMQWELAAAGWCDGMIRLIADMVNLWPGESETLEELHSLSVLSFDGLGEPQLSHQFSFWFRERFEKIASKQGILTAPVKAWQVLSKGAKPMRSVKKNGDSRNQASLHHCPSGSPPRRGAFGDEPVLPGFEFFDVEMETLK